MLMQIQSKKLLNYLLPLLKSKMVPLWYILSHFYNHLYCLVESLLQIIQAWRQHNIGNVQYKATLEQWRLQVLFLHLFVLIGALQSPLQSIQCQTGACKKKNSNEHNESKYLSTFPFHFFF